MTDILDEPLVPVAGAVRLGRAVTAYMHRGFDRPLVDAAELASRMLDSSEGWYHTSRSNPYYRWPVYFWARNTREQKETK